MKKLNLFLFALLAVLFAACSQSSEADGVASKIAKGEALTQADYSTIIAYCGDYASKAQTIQDQLDNLPTDAPGVEALNSQLEAVKEKFPLVSEFFGTLAKATPEQVGEENVKKVDELARMTWFDAPGWASETLDPNAAGLIEDVAPAEGDSAIIAAPALEDKIESK